MKFFSKIAIILIVGLLGTALLATGVDAQKRSYELDRGTRSYMDSVIWSNAQGIGTGGLVDTLIGASAKDTSETFKLANIKSLAATFVWTNSQGTAGGTHAVTCNLQVSIDGQNFLTPTGMIAWSTATSADPSSPEMVSFYSAGRDSAVAKYVEGARFGRLITTQASGAADTTFLGVQVSRQYNPR